MGFYSPTWVRKLVKEDANQIVEYLKKDKTNDFRSYIDGNLPFVLWLDIFQIKTRTLDPTIPELKNIASIAYGDESKYTLIYNMLLQAYKDVINQYIDNPRFIKISSKELESKLNDLTSSSSPKTVIAQEFSNTMIVDEGKISARNKSVMVIFPKFTTMRFGPLFREAVDYSVLGSDNIDEPGRIVKDLMQGKQYKSSTSTSKSDFFTQLQNIGHVELDVVSEIDRTVKRGQNSPRLLQALVSLPTDTTGRLSERVSRQFSQQTGQAETRIQVRKRFAGSKMVFEMLVEHGLSVGLPETQKKNLEKAKLERAFPIGSGLTAEIRKNPSILIDLETSKSMKQYIYENLKSLLETGKPAPAYASEFKASEKAPIKIQTNKVKLPKSGGSVPPKSSEASNKARRATLPLTSLQALLDKHLQDVISANMGDGNERRILNYRTGRFAASAKVERLSVSREGMVTAFYTYMKNPYQTFEPGFKQGSPKTRDPKLLIANSIREIAATTMITKMRSVLV